MMHENIIKMNARKYFVERLEAEFHDYIYYGREEDNHSVIIRKHKRIEDVEVVCISHDKTYAYNTEAFISAIIQYNVNYHGCSYKDKWFVENQCGIRFPAEFISAVKKDLPDTERESIWMGLYYTELLHFVLRGFHQLDNGSYAAYLTLNGYKICPIYAHYEDGINCICSDIGTSESLIMICPDKGNKYVTHIPKRNRVYHAWNAMMAFVYDFACDTMHTNRDQVFVDFGEGHDLTSRLFYGTYEWQAQLLTDKALEVLVRTGANLK